MSDIKVEAPKGADLETWQAVQQVPVGEPGPKVLMLGLPGAGKTYSIATALQAGMKVYVLFTEQGQESLLQACKDLGVGTENLFYNRVKAGSPGFSALKKIARAINTQDQKSLQGSKGVQEKDYQQMIDMIAKLENFIDQHGNSHGNASDWDNKCALFIDGMSGINTMAMDLVVGAKPVKTIADWGIAMDAEMRVMHQLVNDTDCMVGVCCHLELQRDEIEGRIYQMPKLLGNKNTADFGRMFSDVVLLKQKGTQRYLDTISKNIQLKTRNLPEKENQAPSLLPLIKNWAERYDEQD